MPARSGVPAKRQATRKLESLTSKGTSCPVITEPGAGERTDRRAPVSALIVCEPPCDGFAGTGADFDPPELEPHPATSAAAPNKPTESPKRLRTIEAPVFGRRARDVPRVPTAMSVS